MGRTACTEPQCLYNGVLYLFFTVDEDSVNFPSQHSRSRPHIYFDVYVYLSDNLSYCWNVSVTSPATLWSPRSPELNLRLQFLAATKYNTP